MPPKPPSTFPMSLRPLQRVAFVLALLLPVWLAGVQAAPAVAPEPSDRLLAAAPMAAPADVEVLDFEWTDTARQRDVPARLYWPAGAASSPVRVPLIVFSHGLGGSRFGYSHLGRHWAAQGYASLHLQHKGSDRAVWTQGVLDLVTNLQAAASEGNAIARAQDVSFGITRVLAEPRVGQRIDGRRIAVAGHSYGANTALLVAGATVVREVDGERRDVNLRDERVRAAVLLSTPPFYGEGDPRSILSGIRVPTLHVTGTEDVIRIPGYRSDPSDRVRVFDAMPAGPGAPVHALAVFAGGTHSIFTDRTDRAGPELNRSVKAATRELTTEFFRVVFDGEPAERVTAWLRSRGDQLARGSLVPGWIVER